MSVAGQTSTTLTGSSRSISERSDISTTVSATKNSTQNLLVVNHPPTVPQPFREIFKLNTVTNREQLEHRMYNAIHMLFKGGGANTVENKQYYIDQAIRDLAGQSSTTYNNFVDYYEYDTLNPSWDDNREYEWDVGSLHVIY